MRNQSWSSKRNMLVTVIAVMIVTLAVAGTAAAGTEGPFDLKFTGVIEAVGPDSWTVGGQVLSVDESTVIRLPEGPAEAGMWADVQADRQGDDTWLATWITVRRPEARLKGPILVRPEGDVGTWVIGGQPFEGTEETRINERLSPVDVGYWAEVYAVEDPAGTLVAQRIRGIEIQQTVKVYGAIRQFGANAWVLSGMPLSVDEDTLIAGEPQVGLLAHAEAILQDDDTLLALHIKPVWIEPNAYHPDAFLTGTVEELPLSGLVGAWTVEGQAVVVTPATVINESKGLVEVGAVVHVVGWQEDDAIVAIRVTVVGCPGQCGQMIRFRGQIQAMPHNGLLGQWAIGGQRVQVNQRTRVEGAQHAQIGAPAEVGAVQRHNGELVATWLRIRPGRPDGETLEPPPIILPGQ